MPGYRTGAGIAVRVSSSGRSPLGRSSNVALKSTSNACQSSVPPGYSAADRTRSPTPVPVSGLPTATDTPNAYSIRSGTQAPGVASPVGAAIRDSYQSTNARPAARTAGRSAGGISGRGGSPGSVPVGGLNDWL